MRSITDLFIRNYGQEYERPVTNRWLGQVIRRRLNLMMYKSHGNFVIPMSQQGKLEALFEGYGVTDEDVRGLASGGLGDVGTAERVPAAE